MSDASYNDVTGKCGYGVAIIMKDLCILKHGSIRGAKSSCEAELLAAKKGLDYLKTKEFKSFGREVKKVSILSDNFCVQSLNDDSGYLTKWKNRQNKVGKRLVKIADKMRSNMSSLERGFEVFHIKAHNCGTKKLKYGDHTKLEYEYNAWCDQSARKSMRYGLKGKKVIHCQGFTSVKDHEVKVPVGARKEYNKKLAQILQ